MRISITKNHRPSTDNFVVTATHFSSDEPYIRISHTISRKEVLGMMEQMGHALKLSDPGIGRAGQEYHRELRKGQISRCRKELFELRTKLGQLAARIDILTLD